MYLHLLLPDRAQVDQLFDVRMPGCVSLYLATDPADGSGAAQIEFRNLWQEARSQLQADGRTDRDLETMDEQVDELAGDEDFWAHQARSLAVFLNDDGIVESQLPNDLASAVHVSDRFHLKPLLRALTFPRPPTCWPCRRTRRGCWRSFRPAIRCRCGSPTCPATPSTPWVCPRSAAASPTVGCRVARVRRCDWASSAGPWTRRCGRC